MAQLFDASALALYGSRLLSGRRPLKPHSQQSYCHTSLSLWRNWITSQTRIHLRENKQASSPKSPLYSPEFSICLYVLCSSEG